MEEIQLDALLRRMNIRSFALSEKWLLLFEFGSKEITLFSLPIVHVPIPRDLSK